MFECRWSPVLVLWHMFHCVTKQKALHLGSDGKFGDFLQLCVLWGVIYCGLDGEMFDLALFMESRVQGSDGMTGVQGRKVWFPYGYGCR